MARTNIVLRFITGFVRIATGMVTALLLISLLLVAWVLLTTTGLRTVLEVVEWATDGEVRVAEAQGRLFGGFTLEGVEVNAAGTQVNVERVMLDWSPSRLPAATIRIVALDVDGVRVDLPAPDPDAPEPEDSGPVEVPDIRLPARLLLERLSVTDVQVTQAGEPLVEIDAARLAMRWGGRRIAIDELFVVHPEFGTYTLTARLRTPPQQLHIRELTLTGPGEITARGMIPLDFGEAPPDATLDLSWRDLHWPMEGERLFESPSGALSLRGPLLTPKLTASLSVGPEGQPLGHAELDAHWRGEDFDARVAWRDLVDPMNPEAPLWSSRRGELVAGGRVEDWRATLDAEAEAMEQPLRLGMRARGDMERAQIEGLRLDALNGRVDVDGRVRWAPEVGGELNARIAGVDPGRLVEAFPGHINGRVEAVFALPESGPDARVRLRLTDSQLREYPLRADVRAHYANEILQIPGATVDSGDSRVRVAGRATPPFALEGAIDSPNLAALAPDVAGRLHLDFRVAGELETLRVVATGEASELAAAGVAVGALNLDADVNLAGESRLRLNVSELLAGLPVDELRLALDGRLERHTLTLDATSRDGELSVGLRGGAELEPLLWEGDLALLDFVPSDIGAWRLESPARIRAGTEALAVAPACLSGEGGRACVDVDLDLTRVSGSVAFSLEDLLLGYFQPFLPPGMVIDGRIDGSGDATLANGALARAEVGLEITPGTLSVPDAPPLVFGPGRIYADTEASGEVHAGLDMVLADGMLSSELTLSPGREGVMRLDGDVALDLPDLDFLPVFSPEVLEASGSIQGRLRISGDTEDPVVDGRLALLDGRIVLDTPGLTLTDLNAEVHADASRQVRLEVGVRSDEGQIRVDGEMNLAASPITADIRISGEDFQAANLPEVRVWIEPDLRIRLAEELRVTGTVTVPRGMIEPQKFEGGGGVTVSRDQVIVSDDSDVDEVIAGLPIFAEITVVLGDDVRLEGYGLETRLGGRLTVLEEPGRLTRGRGELRLEDGKYQAYGQDLSIERGRLIFDSGPVIEPGLDFRAVRRPRRDILVGIQVRGTLDQPAFQLFSEPPMQQDEQLSWLVLGRPLPSGEGESDQQAMLAAAALSLGLQGGDWLAGRLGGGLGLDEISVGADPGEDPEQARLTVGRYIGSRLYISYGVSLFQPGHIYRLRYDLGRGFALQGETGIHSGGDLLYTVERGGTPRLDPAELDRLEREGFDDEDWREGDAPDRDAADDEAEVSDPAESGR